jgi:hypothetical protein
VVRAKRVPLPDISTVARAALDQFIVDLVGAGFDTNDGRRWLGPLDSSLVGLTAATTMTVVIRDGWPFLQPQVLVDGLRPSVHLCGNLLCLWEVGDDSLAWLRLDDVRKRIAQWADRYGTAATADDPILDPHRYWPSYNPRILATVDIAKIPWGAGGSGSTTAKLEDRVLRIGGDGDLRVRWYGCGAMPHPPSDISMIMVALTLDQRRNLERSLEHVNRPRGFDVLMVIWTSPVGEPNVLVLRFNRSADDVVTSEAVEVARTDEQVLVRRAGGDAPALRSKSVVVFGQGAIGSNVSVLLARSGTGALRLVDGDRLRPGDVVRHAGGALLVGCPKPFATMFSIQGVAPWTQVSPYEESSWNPKRLAALADGADLVIDAVGQASFTEQLSRLLIGSPSPILSAALYRGGALVRVRVYTSGGLPIHERMAAGVFPPIPPGPVEPPVWETGCAGSISNAPPASVASAAAFATRIAIELMTARETSSFDAIELYKPLESPPFDKVGIRRFTA